MSAIAETTDESEYATLLVRTLPHVIHTREENERYIAELEALDRRSDVSAEEERLAELLTLLTEDFEGKNYSLDVASPVDMVRHLMEANGLRQRDMVGVFGTASIASEAPNGKRGLAKSHIENLSRKFNVSPELFFA
jgi:HTH-type transcriptional regulator/antitoxin HigA